VVAAARETVITMMKEREKKQKNENGNSDGENDKGGREGWKNNAKKGMEGRKAGY
jgi:hypothetical protein